MRTVEAASTPATATLVLPHPGPGVAVRVESAHAVISASAVVTPFPAAIRQRRSQDTWAELDPGTRVRLWYLSLSPHLHARMQQAGHLMLFPRQGREFFDLPVLDLVPGDALPAPPQAVGAIPAGYRVFTFPEIEGEVFMIRTGLTPEARLKKDPKAPADPDWPAKYLFSVQDGDLTCFGPSYPDAVEIRFGTDEPAYIAPGKLTDSVQTPDLGPALQAAVDQALAQASGAGALTVPVTASSSSPGGLELAAEAELALLVSAFPDGKTTRELVFTESVRSGAVSLGLPAAGTPREATVEIEGSLVQSVVMTELGHEPSASGADVIGIRLRRGVIYLQKLEVDAPYDLVAIDVRLAWARPDTLLVVELRTADGVSRGELHLAATSRLPGWATIALASPLPLAPKGSHELAVWVERGEVTWLCGQGSELLALRRDDGAAPVRPVVDVNGGAPMTGRLRARALRTLDTIPLIIELEPGGDPLAPADTEIRADGSFRLKLDLLESLRTMSLTPGQASSAVTLRIQSASEGAIMVMRPRIAHALHIEGST
jgi:hypothetical protein